MSWFADKFPTTTRHWTVLRTAWSAQNDNDRNAKPQAEHEFLPAALEIMEKPPSPGLRILTLTLCSLFAIAILWSFIGKVDVVAVATGKTLPQANVKIIQPIEIGAVRTIHVRNGQKVKKGQLLIELDPTIAGADEAQAGRGLMSAQIVEARNRALLSHMSGRSSRFDAPSGTPSDVDATQRTLIRSSIAEYEAERASLTQARAEQAANLAGACAEVAKLRETLPLIERGYAKRKELTDKGYFSEIRLLDYEQQRVELMRNIDVQQANAARARAAMANLSAQMAKLEANFARTSSTEMATAQDDASVRGEELTKSTKRREYQQLRSPIDGTVQQLSITTIGGIVQPAQALMVIVPEGGDIYVEAQVLNKDIGFVHEGQPVRVKLEAFPFTDYGLIPATVENISRDAIERDLPSFQGSSPSKVSQQESRMSAPGLVYMARIKLHRTTIRIAGKDQQIGPGMAVQAEIKTGERRIIKYLLSPIQKAADEAGRER
jgi:hemolysin D